MSTTATLPENLVGSIERVTFHNPGNGFALLEAAVKGRRELVTVVGHLAFVIPGEYVAAGKTAQRGWTRLTAVRDVPNVQACP